MRVASSTVERLRFEAAGLLGQGLIGAFFATIRCEKEGAENYLQFRRAGEPVVFVFWHAQLLPLVYVHRNEGVVVLVSDHADGEYIARVIHRFGFGTARGSSTRGGVKGLKGLLRAAREGRDLALTPDGPLGPRHVFKGGALVAAQRAGLPIIPVALGCSRAWRLDSWDRFMIPQPFSRIVVRYGKPYRVPREAPAEELELHARRLQEVLNRMTEEVARRWGS